MREPKVWMARTAPGATGVASSPGASLGDGLPGEAGQLLEQVAVVAEEHAQAFADGPDELAVRDVVHGRDVKNKEALANPDALELFCDLPELQS